MSKKVISNLCSYPAPELCPNYDTIKKRCCDESARCSYHGKQNKAIVEKIKNCLPVASSDLVFPRLTINTEIPEIPERFQYPKRMKEHINSKEKKIQ